MDAFSSHLTAASVRSRSSQSPSPSHSASASASATSSIHKRIRTASEDHAPPFPHSFSADTRDGALTSNDDLESISARCRGDIDTDSETSIGDDEDDFDHSSLRAFTASRLENASGVAPTTVSRSTKPKSDVPDLGISRSRRDGLVSSGLGISPVTNSVPSLLVKEDSSNIFTDNLQTSGAYSAREESLKKDEEAGILEFTCISNDDIDEHMIWLIGLKNIFAKQLPKMPKEYIVRLVMDRNHKSMMVLKHNQVVGGITYRPYSSQKFGEIAFCAITADEQVKGYGTRLMNHLKKHAREVDMLTHFLAYADKNAVVYFIKQGFSKEIDLVKEIWNGYIKDYDGGILMQCKIESKLPYTDLSSMVRRQRMAIYEKIRELSKCHIVYHGIDFQKKEAGIPKKIISVEDIPGLRDAGWTHDMWGHSRFKSANAFVENFTTQKSLTLFMRSLLKSMDDHLDSWPFKEPVDTREVPDYLDIIKDPMDLKMMSKRVESEQYYVTFEMFLADVKRMFMNARTYNSPDTIYYKCATRLESHFSNRVQSGLESGISKGLQ